MICGIKRNIEQIDKKKNIKQMKSMYKEINWLVKDGYINDSAMDSLNALLFKKFHSNLLVVSKLEKIEIQKIFARGQIRNAREYELMKQEEEIYNDNSQFEYAEAIRNMLRNFEIKP